MQKIKKKIKTRFAEKIAQAETMSPSYQLSTNEYCIDPDLQYKTNSPAFNTNVQIETIFLLFP